MTKWSLRKPESTDVRGVCVLCEVNPQKKISGKDKYKAICSSCDKKLYQKTPRKKRKSRVERKRTTSRYTVKYVKLKNCRMCGFESEHLFQFDVDHIDGDHSNNHPDNLQTLCANCHRLKTFLNKEGIYKNKKAPEEINLQGL